MTTSNATQTPRDLAIAAAFAKYERGEYAGGRASLVAAVNRIEARHDIKGQPIKGKIKASRADMIDAHS